MNELIINFQQNKGCFTDNLYALRQFTPFATLISSAKNKFINVIKIKPRNSVEEHHIDTLKA